jgi:hypothetical protein
MNHVLPVDFKRWMMPLGVQGKKRGEPSFLDMLPMLIA